MTNRHGPRAGAGHGFTIPTALVAVALLLAAAAGAAWLAQAGEESGNPPAAVRAAFDASRTVTATATATAAAGTAEAAELSTEVPPATNPRTAAMVLATAPTIELEPDPVGTGEAILVSVVAPGAVAATLRFRGEAVPLMPEGDLFWAVVGVPVTAVPGRAVLSIETRTASGAALDVIERGYEIVAVARPVDALQLPEEMVTTLLAPEVVEEEARLRAQQLSTYDGPPRWRVPFRLPAPGVITTEFGSARSVNHGPIGDPHTGADVANALGTPVIAAAPGRVSWVGEMPIRGRSVIIDHGAGVLSGYHHLDGVEVAVGALVEAGEVIGSIGSTGLSTGPHLHWELTVWGINVDPLTWTERLYLP